MSEVRPIGLERSESDSSAAEAALRIRWSDGRETVATVAKLRAVCPCATCREKKKKAETDTAKPMLLPVLSVAETQPLRIEGMRPVGNYAYNIAFSDGHDSGIFTFDMLLNL